MSAEIEGLERRYAQTADVWVGGNLFLYYQEGNPANCVAPDVLLAQGVEKKKILWTEEMGEKLVEEAALRRAAEKRADSAEERARALAEELARLRGETTRD